MPTEESIQALVSLGFTGLEAEVYAFLLEEAPATGYRVAQALGRPVANIYKVIESLEAKGALMVDQGGTRLSRAIPASELLNRLDRDFRSKKSNAEDALAGLRQAPSDDRVYQLRTREQVFERCREMIRRAQQLVLADIFPANVGPIRSEIEAAAGRGITAIVKVMERAEIRGARIVLNPRGDELVDRYRGQWLILIVDGAELLIASLANNRRDVHQAIWTSSPVLSWIVHTSFAAELMFCELVDQIDASDSLEQLKAAVQPMIRSVPPLGAGAMSSAERAMEAFSICYSEHLPGFLSLVERSAEHEEASSEAASIRVDR